MATTRGAFLRTAALMAAGGWPTASAHGAVPGRMSVGRWAATATLLPDGRVLVAGGYSFALKDTLRSADLFDPRTEAFSPAEPMRQDRNFATATLLSGGRVLVAGGFSEHHGSLGMAEMFDPASGLWTTTSGPMNDARELYTATLLADGSVLLIGGLSLKKRTTLPTAEWYEPDRGVFTPTTGMLAIDRFGHAAALLSDGRVLIVGGQSWQVGHPSVTLGSAELYDPATGRFTPTGSMRAARDRPTTTTLRDGRVLIAGGTNKGVPPLTSEIYDPKTGLFTSAADMNEGRMAHDACLLPDGRVLVVGGWSDTRKATTPTAEIFDPKADRWSRLPDLPFSAHDLALIPLPDGRVLAVGGKSTQGDEKTARSIDTAAYVALDVLR